MFHPFLFSHVFPKQDFSWQLWPGETLESGPDTCHLRLRIEEEAKKKMSEMKTLNDSTVELRNFLAAGRRRFGKGGRCWE